MNIDSNGSDTFDFRPSHVGRRPRGVVPTALSTTQFSLINCSTICENSTLFCSPDERESSIREVGWFSRISSRMMSLIDSARSLARGKPRYPSDRHVRIPVIRTQNPVIVTPVCTVCGKTLLKGLKCQGTTLVVPKKPLN